MNQPINSISSYLKNHFGKKTVKLAIDGGFTCPNRDGSKGYGGCLFCSEDGSGEFASNIEDQIQLLSEKWPNANYLAYFQNHTNTYAPVEELREKYEKVLNHPLINGIVIATRPDCINEEILDLLSEIPEVREFPHILYNPYCQLSMRNAFKSIQTERLITCITLCVKL